MPLADKAGTRRLNLLRKIDRDRYVMILLYDVRPRIKGFLECARRRKEDR